VFLGLAEAGRGAPFRQNSPVARKGLLLERQCGKTVTVQDTDFPGISRIVWGPPQGGLRRF
jgi:hypothetical protein